MTRTLKLLVSLLLLFFWGCANDVPFESEVDKDARRGDSEAIANRNMGYVPDAEEKIKPADNMDDVHWVTPDEYFEGQYQLGLAYLHGDGYPQDDTEAFHKFNSASTYYWHINANYELARCYLNGTGTRKNLEEAYYWMSIAAAKEHPEAIRQKKIMNGYISQETKQKATQRAEEYFQKNARLPVTLPE